MIIKNEFLLVKRLYNYIKTNSSKNAPINEKTLMKKFNLTREQLKHYLHVMQYKFNFPMMFEFHTIKDKEGNKTLCHYCREKHGIFRPIKKKIEAKGTKISGLFICNECYKKFIDKK